MEQSRLADATRGLRHVFVRDLCLMARIGIYAHEHAAPQKILVNVDLAVTDTGALAGADPVGPDRLSRVVDYEQLANKVRALIADGHVKLVETLAERIAQACLADPRVDIARVRVEKLDILPDAGSVGVEVERRRR